MHSRNPQPTAYPDLMKPGEDWRNLQNSAERRKLQNRIAQRAYRRNMRERSNEVEVLKQRIRHLKMDPWDESEFDALDDTSVAEDPSRHADLSGSCSNAGRSKTAQNESKRWSKSKSCCPEDGSKTMQFTTNNQDASNSSSTASFSDLMDGDSIIPSPVPQITSSGTTAPTSCSNEPAQYSRARRGSAQNRWGQLHGSDPSPRSVSTVQPAALGNQQTSASGAAHGVGQSAPDFIDMSNFDQWSYGMPVSSTPIPQSSGSETVDVSTTKPDCRCVNDQARPTLLHLAITSGNADTLQLLLQSTDAPIDTKDDAGYTPLQLAIIFGRPDLVAILLEHIDESAADENVNML